MEFTKSFPPVDALMNQVMNIDYQKLFKNSKTFVLTVAAIVYVIATLIAEKWQEYDCTERLQLFVIRITELAKAFAVWVMNVFVPECKSFYDDCRSFYNVLRTV